MGARHVDFDAVWEELAPSRAAPVVTVHGEQVTLAPDKPVALVLLQQQLQDPDARATLTLDRILGVLKVVLGGDVVDRMVADGLGRSEAVTLTIMLPGLWVPVSGDGDGEGEARPPATGGPANDSSTTSSTGGGSSSPTSTASTGSGT